MFVLLAGEPRRSASEPAGIRRIPHAEVAVIRRDLEGGGYVRRADAGTPVSVLDRSRPLRHAVEARHPVGRPLDSVQSPADVLADRLSVGN